MLAIILASISLAGLGAGQVSVSLHVAVVQNPADLPYRSVELTVRNDSHTIINEIHLRWKRGGPTFVCPATIAPSTKQKVAFALPIVSQQQTYCVRLLAGRGRKGRTGVNLQAPLTWPDQMAESPSAVVERTARVFIQGEAYDPWRDYQATWPRWLLRRLMIAAGVTCLALAAVFFLRRPGARLGAVVLISAAATLGASLLVGQVSLVVKPSGGRPALVAVACRRTTTWQGDSANLAPVYRTLQQMVADCTIVQPGRLTATLRPGQVRLFRLRQDKPADPG